MVETELENKQILVTDSSIGFGWCNASGHFYPIQWRPPERYSSLGLLLFSHSVVFNSAIPWTIAHQAPMCMGFPRQEYWSGLPFPSWGNLPDPEIKPASLALAGRFLPLSHQETPLLRSGNIKKTVRIITGENLHGDEDQQAETKTKWQSWDSRKTWLDAEVSEWLSPESLSWVHLWQRPVVFIFSMEPVVWSLGSQVLDSWNSWS